MTDTAPTTPPPAEQAPGIIDLRPLKKRFKEYRQIFEYIAGGGAIEKEFKEHNPYSAFLEAEGTKYAGIADHPVTVGIKDVHPIYNSRWSPLGIRLSATATPSPKDHAITFVLGTHPNEMSSWHLAREVLKAWKEGRIPHSMTINLVIGGAKNGVDPTLEEEAARTDIGPEIKRGGGIRGFFRAAEKRDSMTIPEYTSYRNSPDNWNRVPTMIEPEANPNPMLDRARELKRYVYNYSDAIISIHTASQYTPCMALLQTKKGIRVLADHMAQKHAKLLTPNPIVPNVMLDVMDTYNPGVVSMDNPAQHPTDPISICVETGGPHWDERALDHSARVADYFIHYFAQLHGHKGMQPPAIAPEEWEQFHSFPHKGVFRSPLGIFHPAYQKDPAILNQYKVAAQKQEVPWIKATNDTYLLGSMNPPFPSYLIKQLHEKEPQLSEDEIRSLLDQRYQELEEYKLTLKRPNNPSLLGNVQPITPGDPMMVGLKNGFIVPAPELQKGQEGYTIFAPADAVIHTGYKEQVLFLMREHKQTIAEAIEPPAERASIIPETAEPHLRRVQPKSKIMSPAIQRQALQAEPDSPRIG